MKKWVLITTCWVFLQSCSQVDNYVLGKDNTQKPGPLPPITSTVKLTPQWNVTTGKGIKNRTYLKLKPVIVGNTLYTADASGRVHAINRHNGAILWSKQLKQNIVSGPASGEGYLALGTNNAHIVLLKQSNGEEVWRSLVSSDVLSKPVIVNHQVVVKTIDGNVYAFNIRTGEKIWVVDHGSPHLILQASSSPVVVDNLVIVGFSDGKLDAIDLNFGTVLWQKSIAYASGSSDVERLVDIDADPIVRSGIVYLATYQGYVGAMSLQNGQFLWNKSASTFQNMALDDQTIYLTDSDDVVWAYNRQTGHVKWKQVGLKARGLTAPVFMNHRLVVGDKTGYLHVLSTVNGELLARHQLNGAIHNEPTTFENRVYVMTANGQLSCLSVS